MSICHKCLNLQRLAPFYECLKWSPSISWDFPLGAVQISHSRAVTQKPLVVTRTGAHQISIKCFTSDAVNQTGQQLETVKVLKRKGRLDEICVEKFPHYSRTMMQSWILQGKVTVDGKVALKAGTSVSRISSININAEVPKYVCRAGYKLEAAIEHFGCDVKDKVALDAGLSTGGFTDCLLQNGAAFVYGVDVGYGQVAEKIRQDSRVCVLERTNLCYLTELPQLVDVVTLDLAFISILMVMPAVLAVMKPFSTLITLIKPQF
jgi:23S rRNA (cytidine1920-2'-O)/16S rRNA (cytidine1409-2'-O)-methyltransferase